jgi:hypothetical protein
MRISLPQAGRGTGKVAGAQADRIAWFISDSIANKVAGERDRSDIGIM